MLITWYPKSLCGAQDLLSPVCVTKWNSWECPLNERAFYVQGHWSLMGISTLEKMPQWCCERLREKRNNNNKNKKKQERKSSLQKRHSLLRDETVLLLINACCSFTITCGKNITPRQAPADRHADPFGEMGMFDKPLEFKTKRRSPRHNGGMPHKKKKMPFGKWCFFFFEKASLWKITVQNHNCDELWAHVFSYYVSWIFIGLHI